MRGQHAFEGACGATKTESTRYALSRHRADVFDDRAGDAVAFDYFNKAGEGKTLAGALADRRDLRCQQEVSVLVENRDAIRQPGIDSKDNAQGRVARVGTFAISKRQCGRWFKHLNRFSRSRPSEPTRFLTLVGWRPAAEVAGSIVRRKEESVP